MTHTHKHTYIRHCPGTNSILSSAYTYMHINIHTYSIVPDTHTHTHTHTHTYTQYCPGANSILSGIPAGSFEPSSTYTYVCILIHIHIHIHTHSIVPEPTAYYLGFLQAASSPQNTQICFMLRSKS